MLVSVQLDGTERTVALAEFEELVRRGAVGAHTPVRIDAVTEGRWVEAGSLALYRDLVDSPEARFLQAWDRPAIPWATAILCGVAWRVWVWTAGSSAGAWLTDHGARWTPAILEDGEVWRALSYGFLHANLGHVANNLIMLAYTGMALEAVIGSTAVAGLFIVSTAVGGALSGWVSPEGPSIGASAADFGFIAGSVVFGARFRDVLPERARSRFGLTLFILMVWVLVNGAFADRVDNWAHFGGLLGGAAFVAALRPAADPAGARWNRRVTLGATAAVALGMGIVAVAGPRLLPYVPVADDGVRTVRPAWWTPGWARNQDSAWTSPTHGATLTVRTRRDPRPMTLDLARDDFVGSFRAADAGVRVAEHAEPVDGVDALRLTVTGEGWSTEAVLAVRGHYVHVVSVEAARPALQAALVDEVLGAVHLEDPAALTEAARRGDSPRGRVARATALADVGRVDEALALLDPADAVTARARLQLLAVEGRPDVGAAVDDALARFPDDRRVWAAAVDALTTAGDDPTAAHVAETARARWPGDRAFDPPG